jgi:mono/diheme cytochrome c family protein
MAGVLALSSQQQIAFLVVGLVFVAFVAALAFAATGRRPLRTRGRPDIPPSMQPGPSDGDLEKPRLEKLQGWGVAFVLFFVVFVPLVWLREPDENLTQDRGLTSDAIARGYASVLLFSEANQAGIGCVRCHGSTPLLGGGENLYNGSVVQVPELANVCGGENTGHAAIHNSVDVKNTIMQGRPGTDMPSWSVRFQGALDDQQIQDLLTFIIAYDSHKSLDVGGVTLTNPDPVPFKENVCINQEAKGYVAPVVPAQ